MQAIVFSPVRIFVAVLAVVTAGGLRAQLGAEIVAQHAARAGERLAALQALRLEGRTFIAGEAVPFVIWAERPNHLRVESFTPQRRVIQGYDGAGEPWIAHTDSDGGAPRDMPAADGRDFRGEAEFDGPLLSQVRRGGSVDYAGEEPVQGRRAQKLLLMSRDDEISFYWVDVETREIVKRLVYRTRGERRVAIETFYRDFKSVAGVLQPHRIETTADGELLYAMVVDRMEANPPIPPGTFARGTAKR